MEAVYDDVGGEVSDDRLMDDDPAYDEFLDSFAAVRYWCV